MPQMSGDGSGLGLSAQDISEAMEPFKHLFKP